MKSADEIKKAYDEIYQESPITANLWLLILENADESGSFESSDKELKILFNARFNDPSEYAL